MTPPSKASKPAGPQHLVVITRHAPRSLDIDNFAGGCKALIDCLRREQLIPDDDPASVYMEFRQATCKRDQQRTEIEIYTPDLQINRFFRKRGIEPRPHPWILKKA